MLHTAVRFRDVVNKALLLSLSIWVGAIFTGRSETVTTPEDAFKYGLYSLVAAGEVQSMEGLIEEFEYSQMVLLQVAPPAPECPIFSDGQGVVLFDPLHFPEWFTAGLVPSVADGVIVYPITVFEDPITRRRVILNTDGKTIVEAEPPADYEPRWLAFERHPPLRECDSYSAYERWLLDAYDPSRIVVTYRLIDSQNLIRYVWRKSLEPEVAMPETASMMRWDGGSVTNLQFTDVTSTSNGVALTLAYPDDFTNRVVFLACSDLLDQHWQVALTTNIDLSTNWIAWVDATSVVSGRQTRFYRA